MTPLCVPASALAFAVILGTLGCGDAPRAADLGVAYDTVGAVEQVTSSGAGVWSGAGGAWTVDETHGVTIGRLEGADEYVFGQISGLVVDRKARIHVADTQAKEIRVFSPDGEFLRRVGRDGEGPGEFRNISGLALAPGGIAALDGSLGRVTVFDSSDTVVRMFRLERSYMILEYNAPMAFDAAGRFFERARLSLMPGIDSIGVITYGSDGAVSDTVLLAEIRQDHIMVERNGMPYMSVPRPFAPQPSIAFGPEGSVYLARGDEYRVDVFSPAGDSLRVIRRTVEPRSVTAAERDSAAAYVTGIFERTGVKAPPGIEIPQRKPAIQRLVVDASGNLWVLTAQEAGSDRFEWSIHDPQGRYLGAVTTPVMTVIQIGDDFLAGTMRGEFDVPSAVVFPIVKPDS